MSAIASLANHFLIAMPTLGDPNFSRTVTYICEHSDDGAMGIVINRPTDISLQDVFQEVGIAAEAPAWTQRPVHLGGPVQNNRGFVLHEPLGDWESMLAVTEDIGVSTSRDILMAIAEHRGPARFLFALGYAGWAGGQLEQEIAQNAWLSGPATREILFETPAEERWLAAAKLLGIDLGRMSHEVGHA